MSNDEWGALENEAVEFEDLSSQMKMFELDKETGSSVSCGNTTNNKELAEAAEAVRKLTAQMSRLDLQVNKFEKEKVAMEKVATVATSLVKELETLQNSVTSSKQEKRINTAATAAAKLSKELSILDFELEKFNKFEKKVSSFKIWNTISIGAVALLLGGYIGSLAQSELNKYWVENQIKSKLGAGVAELRLLQEMKNRGVKIYTDEKGNIVIYGDIKNQKLNLWKNDKNQVFEIIK